MSALLHLSPQLWDLGYWYTTTSSTIAIALELAPGDSAPRLGESVSFRPSITNHLVGVKDVLPGAFHYGYIFHPNRATCLLKSSTFATGFSGARVHAHGNLSVLPALPVLTPTEGFRYGYPWFSRYSHVLVHVPKLCTQTPIKDIVFEFFHKYFLGFFHSLFFYFFLIYSAFLMQKSFFQNFISALSNERLIPNLPKTTVFWL